MNVGEIDDITIGSLISYYDHDLNKQNNPFCALGYRDFIKLLVTAVEPYNEYYY